MSEHIGTIIRESEDNYTNGSTHIGEYVEFEMHETIEKIEAYLNSKHTSGETDSLGREKPFFNIVTAASNIWYRATDLDRKNIRFVPNKKSSLVLSYVANSILQNWMNDNKFGQFLNEWGRTLARYGSSVVKFVEQNGELIPSVVPWNRFIADPVQFDAIPRIEKFYLTPAQLRKKKEYDQDMVDSLIKAQTTRKTLGGTSKDTQSNFIELYEVHGELDSRHLDKEPDLDQDEEIKYVQQMHVDSFVSDGKDYQDFTLYKGKESKDPYMITHLIEEDGRTLAIGAVEHLFDSQWMQNHSVKNIKDTLDMASKLIFQTSDPKYVGRNVLSAIETGDIFIHNPNEPLTRLANDKPDIGAFVNFQLMWQNAGDEITSTPDAMKGQTMPSGTPYSLGAYLGNQAGSLFEIMTENKGLAIEEMMREFVIPHIQTKLNNTDDVVAILDSAGIQELDATYVPKEAVRRYNRKVADQIFKAVENPEAPLPQPFDREAEETNIMEGLRQLGDKRFLKTDEIREKTWKEVFGDFEWSNIRVEVTNENVDKQATLQTLASLYSTTVQQDPVKANAILAKIMSETGVFSPIELASPSPQVGAQGGGQGLQKLAEVTK